MRGTRKNYKTPTFHEVMGLVNTFLEGKVRDSEGEGLAPVLEGDVDELNEIISALIRYRYTPDTEGDRPIRWSLCNWHLSEPDRFVRMPRPERVSKERRLEVAQMNVAIAADELRGIVLEFTQPELFTDDSKE